MTAIKPHRVRSVITVYMPTEPPQGAITHFAIDTKRQQVHIDARPGRPLEAVLAEAVDAWAERGTEHELYAVAEHYDGESSWLYRSVWSVVRDQWGEWKSC